jgi:hypothetical protein
MSILDRFDPYNPEHIKAVEFYLLGGRLVIDQIDYTFTPNVRAVVIQRLALAWLNRSNPLKNK